MRITYLISKLQKLCTMKQLEKTQSLITKTGLLTHPDILTKLIQFASLHPSGNLVHAHAIFDQTPKNNSFVCNTMIRAYSNSISPISALDIYVHMIDTDVECDHYTFTFVLKACGRLWRFGNDCVGCRKFGVFYDGGVIHCRILKLGFDSDRIVENSLVCMYSQCGLMGAARKVFDEMSDKTVASWNVMVSGYDRVNDFRSSDLLLEAMPLKNLVSLNSLISRYVRLGSIDRARSVFDQMPERDAVSWNSMISSYVKIKYYARALDLFREMQHARVEPTEITRISILGVCAETGALEIGREIHESLRQKDIKIEGYLGNALVDMYAKCGKLALAREVFNCLKMKHTSCWNAIIVGLAVHGHSSEALQLFSEMEQKLNMVSKPNRVTFIGVFIACSHKGLVQEGRKYFKRMINEYKIVPDLKHYGCMVDLLSRNGLLNEAYEMIKTMPFEANSVLWRTILAACKVHDNVEMAEEAFKQLAKLEALRDGDYVLLSNIYAECERWNDVERVREDMIKLRVAKKLGSSNVGTG